ncbi:hypothetical protein [Raoultella terrigena]|uniref:hypothetical protein n=1 Tax=Raoultella terrigena TaxID=577 RepID=UPI00384CDB89
MAQPHDQYPRRRQIAAAQASASGSWLRLALTGVKLPERLCHALLGKFAGGNAAASLLEVAPLPYRQENYVICLDFGAWAARCLSGLQAT